MILKDAREVQLQTLVALGRSFRSSACALDDGAVIPADRANIKLLYEIGLAFDNAADKLNEKWGLHEHINFIS